MATFLPRSVRTIGRLQTVAMVLTRHGFGHLVDSMNLARHVPVLKRLRAPIPSPTDTVASYEIGTIGYYAEMPIHDWFGLVTRDPGELPPEGAWMVSFWPDLAEAEGAAPRKIFHRSGFVAYLYDRRSPAD